jgi:hypothetical protein
MNRGLRPILDSIRFEGCPYCGEVPGFIHVNGPDEIVLEGCGHVVDAKVWADSQKD